MVAIFYEQDLNIPLINYLNIKTTELEDKDSESFIGVNQHQVTVLTRNVIEKRIFFIFYHEQKA